VFPDGSKIVTGSSDKTAKVWDAKTMQELGTLKGHSNSVWSVAVFPDGSKIVTGSDDNTAKVWDAGVYFFISLHLSLNNFFMYFGPAIPILLLIVFIVYPSVMTYLAPFNNLTTLLICASIYIALPMLLQWVILPIFNCTLNSVCILLNPIGLLEANKLSLERYAGNADPESSVLDEDEARYWTMLNLANFFLENFTEAIICAILLLSRYEDIFLTMFAIPTIVNASVRFLKILVPFLVYTAFPFVVGTLSYYLSACLNFILSCVENVVVFLSACWEYVSSCFAFILR
jgi:hypothetical protein